MGKVNKREGSHSSHAGLKIPTCLTASPVYKLNYTPVKTTFSFGVCSFPGGDVEPVRNVYSGTHSCSPASLCRLTYFSAE